MAAIAQWYYDDDNGNLMYKVLALKPNNHFSIYYKVKMTYFNISTCNLPLSILTHTHTHTYIYIYIYENFKQNGKLKKKKKKGLKKIQNFH